MKHTTIALLALVWGMHPAHAKEPAKRTEPIPEKYAKETEVSLNLERRIKKADYHILDVYLINPTSSSITFAGYSESSPWYKIQKWVKGKWIDHRVGWFCATGLSRCVILSGQSSIIRVNVEYDLFPIRVGVDYAHGEKNTQRVVWSARIEKNSFNKTDAGDGK